MGSLAGYGPAALYFSSLVPLRQAGMARRCRSGWQLRPGSSGRLEKPELMRLARRPLQVSERNLRPMPCPRFRGLARCGPPLSLSAVRRREHRRDERTRRRGRLGPHQTCAPCARGRFARRRALRTPRCTSTPGTPHAKCGGGRGCCACRGSTTAGGCPECSVSRPG